jgi:hypothetical protein
LACERIVDICEKIIDGQFKGSKPTMLDLLTGYCMANMRTLKRKIKAHLPRAQNKPDFHRHRYPEVSLEDVQYRTLRFQQVLGDSQQLQVEQISDQFFLISGGD